MASASLMRLAVSTMRAPILRSLSRKVTNSATAFGLPQQHHSSIRRGAPAVESSGDLLAPNGWKRERDKASVMARMEVKSLVSTSPIAGAPRERALIAP